MKTISKFHRIVKRNFSIHVDQKDKEFFNKIKDWWNPEGSMNTLHYFNDLRTKYILEKLNQHNETVKDKDIADIGSGAGLLSERLARLGGNVTGIDSNSNSIALANEHLNTYEGDEAEYFKNKLSYFEGSIDNYMGIYPLKKYDIITAMEVIEHVNSPEDFIKDINKLMKENGYLFMSTLNRTYTSYLTAILLAEKITNIIPNGTHEWNKFIKPNDLVSMLETNGFSVQNIQGVSFNPITYKMDYSSSTAVNYLLFAQKTK